MGTFRIVGIGDSWTFGHGVADDETFLAVLGARLNGDGARRPFEVVNTGVPGYNTAMEVEVLADRGLAYEPDVVVLQYCANDLDLPNFIADADDYFSCTKSFLIERVALALRGVDRLVRRPLVGAPLRDPFYRENDPDRVPARYRDLVGLPAFDAAMARLARLAVERDFDVVVVGDARLPEHVRAAAARHGFPLLEAAERIERHMREHGIERFLGSELSVSATDPHGSAITHRLIGELLAERLSGLPRVQRFRDRL